MTGDGIRPDEVVSTLRRTIEASQALPTKTNYLEREPDIGGADAGVKLPLVSFTPVSNIRITDFNTDRDGYVTDTDANGNEVRTGRVFTAEYRLDLQLDIWTAISSSYDVQSLGNLLWDELYAFDSHGPGETFVDSDGRQIESIWRFTVHDGEPTNDYSMTPSLLRWRQDVTVWAYHRFDTSEDYITDVSYPAELSDSDGDGMLSG